MSNKSRAPDTTYEGARELPNAGQMDDITLREFDAMYLTPVKQFSASQIKNLRLQQRASQAVFAAYLNTSKSTIQKWEQGQKKPNGPSLKLLNLVDREGLKVLA